MLLEGLSTEVILFFILYGITGVVPLIAGVYLLLRRSNAFASDITPPLRLRRWAASFFFAMALGHVWWYLFLVYSHDLRSVSYVVVSVLDCLSMLITIAGTLLAMLQDRKRPVWPVVAALIPYVLLGAMYIGIPDDKFINAAIVYYLLFFVIFTVYMVFAVRKYGRWLNDNYADLDNKKVWLSQMVSLVTLFVFILYSTVEIDYTIIMFILHVMELLLYVLLLWRIETLPQLDSILMEEPCIPSVPEPATEVAEALEPSSTAVPTNIDIAEIERLLEEHCVATQLYLQHDLNVQQLAQAIGTNRLYLSQYFSYLGITYNTYINNLRINHFISRYQEIAATGRPIAAQQLAHESGYRSYSTFSLAFKQRTGQSVTAWMRG